MADENEPEAPAPDFRSHFRPEMVILLLLIVPLCIPLLCYPLMWLNEAVRHPTGSDVSVIDIIVNGPILTAYYLVPTVIGILYLVAAWSLLAMAFYRRAYRRKLYMCLLILYVAVAVFYTGYIIWWYSTGQQWEYL